MYIYIISHQSNMRISGSSLSKCPSYFQVCPNGTSHTCPQTRHCSQPQSPSYSSSPALAPTPPQLSKGTLGKARRGTYWPTPTVWSPDAQVSSRAWMGWDSGGERNFSVPWALDRKQEAPWPLHPRPPPGSASSPPAIKAFPVCYRQEMSWGQRRGKGAGAWHLLDWQQLSPKCDFLNCWTHPGLCLALERRIMFSIRF